MNKEEIGAGASDGVMPGQRGLILTVEGIDGTGKTTQVGFLARYLESNGFRVVVAREPGGTAVGELLRQLLLESERELFPETEALLYCAARSQLVREVIRPAVSAGQFVVIDRFIDSTLAYQGYGSGVDLDMLKALNRFVVGDSYPDLTLLFDIDPVRTFKSSSMPDRIEGKGLEYRRRVREGYLELAGAEKSRFRVIDAGRGEARTVWSDVEKAVSDFLVERGYKWVGMR